MYGINTLGVQCSGYTYIFCYTHLKLALLLHKTVLVTFLLASTVELENGKFEANILQALLIEETGLFGMFWCSIVDQIDFINLGTCVW